MRLVIRTRGRTAAGGMGRYQRSAIGSGVFGSLARKVFSAGFKKVINAATKANLPQKIADAAVNGAKSAGEHLGKKAGNKLGQVVREKVVKRLTPLKRSAATSGSSLWLPSSGRGNLQSSAKHAKYDRLINHIGSGIILQ